MTAPEPRAEAEPGGASDDGESETLAESPSEQNGAEVPSDAVSETDESETPAESPSPQSAAEGPSNAVSEADESETLSESPSTQPAAEAEPDAAAVAAEVRASEPPAVEQATADEARTARPRAARAPAWAWVAITLMTLLLAIGLTTLVFARNADPSTPEAVEDAQTLVAEIEALNGYLATTNQLLAGAIESAEQLNAAAQTKLASLSAKLADAEPRVGQARALLGSQLSGTTRSELDNAQQQLQSLRGTLTERSERLAQQELETVKRDVAGLDDRVGAATGQGSGRASANEARIAALESKQAQTDESRAQLQAEPTGPGRGRAAQGGRSGPAGGH